MYVCFSSYSLPFTDFESLLELVQTKLSKNHPETPQVICPANVERASFPGSH